MIFVPVEVANLDMLRGNFERAGHGRDPDLQSPGPTKDSSALRCGGSGGVHVVDYQHFALLYFYFFGLRHCKGAAEVRGAPVGGEAGLRTGIAFSYQPVLAETKAIWHRIDFHSRTGDQFGRVVTALPELGAVQGNGDHCDRA